MISRNKIPLFIALIGIVEVLIYVWATFTTDPEFIFDKCARNSGRVSSFINLAILLMIGYQGYSKIYQDNKQKDSLRILITFFSINHLVHFFYVNQNFKHHTMTLSVIENLHGFITFICIVVVPFIIWLVKKSGPLLFSALTLHLFNVSYFIMKTFYSKIKPEAPAYHNQLGILVTTLAMLYVWYRVFKDSEVQTNSKSQLQE